MRVFLTGFMGVGKSTVGKRLAKLTDKAFVDLDTYIEEKESTAIPQLFERGGEEGFRELESHYLERVIEAFPDAVIAVGGGTPCFHQNHLKMLEAGTVIFLSAPVKTLAQRLWNAKSKRPLLANITKIEELELKIDEMLQERIKFYEKNNIQINILDLNSAAIEDLARKLI